METPESWVILELPDNEYKVFVSWRDGYLNGDSLKINSGIKTVEDKKDHYLFNGHSGSQYKCYKSNYGISSLYATSVLQSILEKSDGNITLLEDRDNWNNLK